MHVLTHCGLSIANYFFLVVSEQARPVQEQGWTARVTAEGAKKKKLGVLHVQCGYIHIWMEQCFGTVSTHKINIQICFLIQLLEIPCSCHFFL